LAVGKEYIIIVL